MIEKFKMRSCNDRKSNRCFNGIKDFMNEKRTVHMGEK